MLRPTLQKLLNTDHFGTDGFGENIDADRSEASTPERSIHSSGSATPESFRKIKQGDEGNGKWEREVHIYEMQLTQLQEQLVAAMVENQQLAAEIKDLKDKGMDTLKKEIDEEKKKTKRLEEQIRRLKPKRPARPLSIKKDRPYNTETDSDFDFDDLSKELHAMNGRGSLVESGDTLPDTELPRLSSDNTDALITPKEGNSCDTGQKGTSRLLTIKIAIWNILHERISDFICDEVTTDQEEEEEQLAVKRLRENVSRFTDGIQPIKAFVSGINRLFAWRNPWMTLSAFLIYMYSVWLGLFVPLVFLLAIIKLTKNFLYAKGIAQRFGYHGKRIEKEEQKDENTSWSEKYQLVLQIARKVQNTLGILADSLEKIESLFWWRHEEATKKLYTVLCLGFAFSLLLSTRIFFVTLGLALGIKMFVVTPLYNRFPKVKQRYDDVDRLWNELPTLQEREFQRAELLSNGNKAEETPKPINEATESSRPSSRADSGEDSFKSNADLAQEWIVFCDRFQLPSNEIPLLGWQDGRRCTLLNKDNPLSNMKHGRLYLTKHFLCFERNQYHSKKNLAFHLQDIVYVVKAKPLSFLPGGGMAIEVKSKTFDKPFTFGAMMGRDEAYDSIIQAAKTLNLPWAKR